MASNQRKRRQPFRSSSGPRAKRLVLAKPMQLDDLNEDVLEKIFSYLDVQDLVNVVKSDRVFLNCSRTAFKRKYKNTFIWIPFFMRDGFFATRQDFSRNVDLLRYFGESMTSVELRLNGEIEQRLLRIVDICCRKAELKISYPTVNLEFKKSYPKVQKLTFYHGRLNFTSHQLIDWFPSLENLTFDCIPDVGSLLKSTRKIASLKCLSLDISKTSFNSHFYCIQDVNSFVAANPQLIKICLDLSDRNVDALEWLQQATDEVRDEIVPDQLMSVKLKIQRAHSVHSNPLAHLKIPNDRIAYLEFYFDKFTVQMVDYIAKCVNIQTLKIGRYSFSDPWITFRAAGWMNMKNFGSLSRIEISMPVYLRGDAAHYSKFALELIGPFLKYAKSLNNIVLHCPTDHRDTAPHHDLFDSIRFGIHLKIWTLAQDILSDEIKFTLAKVLTA